MATKAISLHIGLNRVDPNSYEGWNGQLRACEADAACMASIAQKQKYASSTSIVTEEATADAVLTAIKKASTQLQTGDLFLLTYSGHGGRIPDPEIENRQVDTWVLYDRMVISHELYRCWGAFASGVRIFMLSDSCHSGTMAKNAVVKYMLTIASTHEQLTKDGLNESSTLSAMRELETQGANIVKAAGIDDKSEVRAIDPSVQIATYAAHQGMYDQISRDNPASLRAAVTASVLLISGCQDLQTSADGARNGLFTAALLAVWKDGQFSGNYPTFHEDIQALMPDTQQPNYFPVGAESTTWTKNKPFVP